MTNIISDKDYSILDGRVYEVDSGKTSSPIGVGDKLVNKKYQVLRVENNQSNGMQAMAVAPIVDGKFVS